jgi:choline-sulfatase
VDQYVGLAPRLNFPFLAWVEYYSDMRLGQCIFSRRILFLAVLLAWAPLATRAEPSPAPAGSDGPAPVILISVDTLRADHLSCYGYSRLATPHIDSLARGGTVFAEISSQAPITLPSHVSLFTSTYPFANGIRENAQVLPPGAVTLATVLAAQGYNTAAFIGGFSLERRYGLAQGFQTYDSPFDRRVIKGALDLKRPASQVLEGAEHWLGQNSGRPFLLFIHLFDLHQPYDAPAAYRARAPQSEYDQELAYVDDSLGTFFEFLARSGLDRRALVVLFSDHGESLGDHGENTHGYFIYRSTLHVPLIFHWPRAEEIRNSKLETRNSAQVSSFEFRVSSPAGLIDVAPTVLSFLGFPAPVSFCGHSLLDLARGGNSPPRDVYSESFYAHDKFGWAGLRSLRRGDYQYIDAPHPELYDLKHDPAERHNLLPGQTALAASYREAWRRWWHITAPRRRGERPKRRLPPCRSSAESLRALGYLEITSPHAALNDSGVDPKDRLFEYKRYLLAGHLARIGKAEEAAAEFQAILADDPRNLPAYIELARSDVGLHRYLDGANKLKAALALDPHNVEAEELLGDIWLAVGDHGRAARSFINCSPSRRKTTRRILDWGSSPRARAKDRRGRQTFSRRARRQSALRRGALSVGLDPGSAKPKKEAVREFKAALQIDPPVSRRRAGSLPS